MTESKDISNILKLFNEKELDIIERINDQYKGFNRKNNKFTITTIGFEINNKGGIIPYIEFLNQKNINKERKLKNNNRNDNIKWIIGTLLVVVGLIIGYFNIPKNHSTNSNPQETENSNHYEEQQEEENSKLDSTLTTKPIQKVD
jgi:predicted histidine transporter YuiF (NhaC family)